ncbi:MAG: hypothetical protein M3Z41_09970 [Candidatus Eremiobacteraeota bacterium]|nr:hypothetical protein [Candidatus Eremiobacteraeota bacterium]
MNPGDILLFYRPKGRDLIISLLTKSPYFHVALCVAPNVIVEAVPKGVRQRDLRASPDRHPFHVIPGFAAQREAAVQWALSQVGDGYDDVDLLVIVLHRLFKLFRINRVVGDRYTCGEFVASAYEHAGRRLFPDIDSEDAVPADFERFLTKRGS